jgi:hypothetical protein
MAVGINIGDGKPAAAQRLFFIPSTFFVFILYLFIY